MRVAVAGGTGMIGRMVVADLTEAGHDTVILARDRGIDLVTGDGIAGALSGCDAVVDVTNRSTIKKKAAIAFFGSVTRNLLAAEVEAGVRHHVALSIVGVETIDMGYYVGKREQEKVITTGPVPWTILRATQFHAFAEPLLDNASGPFVMVPSMLTQPIAPAEVAAALATLAVGPPAGHVRPMAGPEQLRMTDMARRLMRARGQRKLLIPVRLPGRVGTAMTTGGLLPQEPYTKGEKTFAEYLSHVTPGRR